MKASLAPRELRSLSKAGELTQKRKSEETAKENKKQQHSADLKEAQDRIREANEEMARAASRGEREARVCVLRGGIHFKREFYTNQSPKFLETIGKAVYNHFTQRGFKVEFRHWMDGMRIGELESDGGYEVVVIW